MLDSSSITMILILVVLVILSAYFSATETAFTSLNRIRLKSKADGGKESTKPFPARSFSQETESRCPGGRSGRR